MAASKDTDAEVDADVDVGAATVLVLAMTAPTAVAEAIEVSSCLSGVTIFCGKVDPSAWLGDAVTLSSVQRNGYGLEDR